jgi:hypothetical protein
MCDAFMRIQRKNKIKKCRTSLQKDFQAGQTNAFFAKNGQQYI